MKQNNDYENLRDSAKKIQDILLKNNFEIVTGPNIGNAMCYWLVKQGRPYHEGVYLSKIDNVTLV